MCVLLQLAPHLTSLDISGCAVTATTLDRVASLSRLQRLGISGLHDATDTWLGTIAAGCPALQRLDISQCPRVLGPGVECLVEGCLHLSWVTALGACTELQSTLDALTARMHHAAETLRRPTQASVGTVPGADGLVEFAEWCWDGSDFRTMPEDVATCGTWYLPRASAVGASAESCSPSM